MNFINSFKKSYAAAFYVGGEEVIVVARSIRSLVDASKGMFGDDFEMSTSLDDKDGLIVVPVEVNPNNKLRKLFLAARDTDKEASKEILARNLNKKIRIPSFPFIGR